MIDYAITFQTGSRDDIYITAEEVIEKLIKE